MSPEEKEKGFDYEAHERLKKELEEAGAKGLEEAETSDANEDEELIHDSGELPPFWKPEQVGEKETGILCSVRKTQFEKPALHLRTSRGMIAIPVGDGMADVNFEALVGRRLTFKFKGLAETKAGRQVKQFRITAGKLPF